MSKIGINKTLILFADRGPTRGKKLPLAVQVGSMSAMALASFGTTGGIYKILWQNTKIFK